MENEPLIREYYTLFETVNEFDQRLLTIKGWGVTLSLAALGSGFQFGHYGLFLVAAISGLAFWLIEGVVKRHQMRFYPRMREIEVIQFNSSPDEKARQTASPQIDWSWTRAKEILGKGHYQGSAAPEPYGKEWLYRVPWAMLHVCLPHALTVIAGVIFWKLGRMGTLGNSFHW